MSLQISKAKSATGIALVSAILAGCGGGGGSAPSVNAPPAAGFTAGSSSCGANQGADTFATSSGALLGSCEEYTASIAPTRVSTAFKSAGTQFPLTFSATAGYTLSLPVLEPGSVTISAASVLSSNGGLLTASLGDLSGTTVQFIPPADTSGAASTVYDFGTTKDKLGQPLMNLKYSRYGVFSRFKTRVEGYYGGWALGTPSTSPLPTSSTTFTGFVTGVLGRDAASPNSGAASGFAAKVVIIVDATSTANPVKSVLIEQITYSSAAGAAPVPLATVSSVVPSASTMGVSGITAQFSSADLGAGKGLSNAALAGSFWGAGGTALVSEIAGTIKFTTTDGRNGIGAFGAKTGALLQP
jgi:hypothetical protein